MIGIRDFVVRFFLCIALSPVAGLLWMLAQYLIDGINPLDVWETLFVYLTIGAIAGAIVGAVWGLDALLAHPPVNLPSPTPVAPTESN